MCPVHFHSIPARQQIVSFAAVGGQVRRVASIARRCRTALEKQFAIHQEAHIAAMMNHRFQGNNPNLPLRRPVRARAQAKPPRCCGWRAGVFDFEWLVLVLLFSARACLAAGIDHVVDYDNRGIWKRSNQQALLYTLVGGEIVGALRWARWGYYAHSRENPLILGVLPKGFVVGLHKQF